MTWMLLLLLLKNDLFFFTPALHFNFWIGLDLRWHAKTRMVMMLSSIDLLRTTSSIKLEFLSPFTTIDHLAP